MEINREKLSALEKYLWDLGSVVVAFSGGIDSTFLAKAAFDALGDKALAVTGNSEVNSEKDLLDAREFAAKIGIRHRIIKTDEINQSEFHRNDKNRCYYCKSELFGKCLQIARSEGFSHVIEGSNFDDLDDYRPGMKASCDLNIKQPLVDLQISKEEIRRYLKNYGYSIWNKPASPCLSSRIPFGNDITNEKLRMIEDCEVFLRQFGFYNLRVRHHGEIARIEVDPGDFAGVTENSEEIIRFVKGKGFSFVVLDLAGFKSGSFNDLANQME